MRTTALLFLLLGCARPRTVQPSQQSQVASSTGSETTYVEQEPAMGAQPMSEVPPEPEPTPAPAPIAEPGPSEPVHTAEPTPTPTSGSETTPTTTPPAATGVTATSATSWTITQAVWDELMRDAMSLARIVPETQGSQTIGFRLAGIRAATRLTELGFANGDVIQTVNGVALRSIANAISLTSQRNASDFRIELLRDGAPRVHEYHVVRSAP